MICDQYVKTIWILKLTNMGLLSGASPIPKLGRNGVPSAFV